jgi:hypothetical protein
MAKAGLELLTKRLGIHGSRLEGIAMVGASAALIRAAVAGDEYALRVASSRLSGAGGVEVSAFSASRAGE